jgi:hypothetical protein
LILAGLPLTGAEQWSCRGSGSFLGPGAFDLLRQRGNRAKHSKNYDDKTFCQKK